MTIEKIMQRNLVLKSGFKTRALEFFRQVEFSGESLIVTDHGKPVLEVRPYRRAERCPLDALRGTVVKYDNLTASAGEDDCEAAR
ncbi:type II toxin-antitoxin system Phd/YefM family antitoxin [Paraburkholderia xenovorans]|uniref:type II toxin-antitoxin system Phd/YefM family antitoxin n=1 Tax=Paraburkholderia xenovorans TaxID=36873 RepID=UPI0020A68444|nr:type II toxin-antitoxin system Phd/YefM family antitoxin [Paraburkholderia xenovorans]